MPNAAHAHVRHPVIAEDPVLTRRHILGRLVLGRLMLGSALAGCAHLARSQPAVQAPPLARTQLALLPSSAHVLALGDSLTVGMGATEQQSWPAELARLSGWKVDNAGRIGDTSSGAMARLDDRLARHRYDAIIIGIGGNDMLQNVPRATTIRHIRQLLRHAQQHTPHVALLATPQPDLWRASLGHLEDAPFYAELAAQEQVLLLPGVYTKVLNQADLRTDQIHANARGYALMARDILAQLRQAQWLAPSTHRS